ncbi:MAG: UDP-N-acetylmuramoyl-L-alanyl-D-glutamate--2,6-diaminopimelate ligase [Spirochaetes bacterium]|nr:UDP-N-acetylmuramoyl-L-alanyl-D-glutamate--2,6-diaminopimelate ligase [Spirochaetota bacterium]
MSDSKGVPLSILLSAIDEVKRIGNSDPLVKGIAYDSREVQPGYLFCALEGIHTDGHRYIEGAIKAGAVSILCRKMPPSLSDRVVYLQVEDPRKAMSRLSAALYQFPSRSLKVIGVTGTDGKSSTVYYIHQFLELLGKKSGLLSTVSLLTGGTLEKNPLRQSTPEAPIIQEVLAEMRDAGKEFAIVEATSHGLSHRTSRLLDVEFDVGVLTNVTHEHLEFHGSWENYLSDKTNLFRALSSTRSTSKACPSFGVTNRDDRSYAYVREHCKVPLYSYSIKSVEADLFATQIDSDLEGNTFQLHENDSSVPCRIPLPGMFNVENVLAALLTVSRLEGVPALSLSPLAKQLKGVRGRMTPIQKGQPFSVLVDYAHTPGAFEKLFPQVRKFTPGRLIAVFGSAGERDVEKRPLQGGIASQYADLIILTNEDPRLEDPMQILEDIAKGCGRKTKERDLFLIPDRMEAIRFAFQKAEAQDTVLLLGKGHESSIILASGPIPWDEIEVAVSLLEELGYRER